MTDSLILIGGPRDGLEIRAELTAIPRTIRVPAPPVLVHLRDPGTSSGIYPTTALYVLTYRLEHADDGAPSRDDQGRIRYRLEAAL